MSRARAALLERLAAYREAAASPELVAGQLTDRARNEKARLFRNGLIIVGFALLEDFIRERCREVLKEINSSFVSYAELPERLQRAATVGAVSGLSYQVDVRSRSGEAVEALIRATRTELASTGTASYALSGLSFVSDRPNLNAEELKQVMQAFGVSDPWGNIDGFANRVGLSAPSHEQAFKNAHRWRNSAAQTRRHSRQI